MRDETHKFAPGSLRLGAVVAGALTALAWGLVSGLVGGGTEARAAGSANWPGSPSAGTRTGVGGNAAVNSPYHTVDGSKHGPSNIFTIRAPNIFYHNVGLLELFVCNIGRVGNGQLGLDSYSAGWRGGEYLYIGAMWIGAIASDNLSYVTTGGYDFELLPSLDPIDTMYPAYEGIPGGNRPGFSAQPDDDNDGETDEEFHNGKDDDGDGRIDEDYAAISQQMYSCEYWDYGEEARNFNAEHRPLNVRVRQNSYAWSTEGSNEFAGFDFEIINDGFEVLREVYLGFFVDSDAGPKDHDDYFTDDGGYYVSLDTTFVDPSITYSCGVDENGDGSDDTIKSCGEQSLHLDIMAMFDRPDDGERANGGDVDGVFGGMFLGHTTDPFGERAPARVAMHTARFFSGSNPYPLGDPRNDAERYDLLQSGDRSGRETSAPDDYRYTFSAGPFRELNPGEKLFMQAAFVVGKGREGMISNAIKAQIIYNGAWKDVDSNPVTGKDGKETCLHVNEQGEQLFWRDPCDSLSPDTRTIKDIPCLPQNYVDNDCDCCTPLFRDANEAATAGLEGLVHWVGTVAPPPPKTNIDERSQGGTGLDVRIPDGERKVILAWDNNSELAADPIQRKILFTGYKVWRVEGWDRPVGATGPGPDQWQQIDDLSLRPADSLGIKSPHYLNHFRRDIDSLYVVKTGSTVPGEEEKWYYPVGRYEYVDTLGLKNGMLYFYDVTAYSVIADTTTGTSYELGSRPTAVEADAVIPRWDSRSGGSLDEVIVVPNPYIRGENPFGWDLVPSDSDPTGTKLAFARLPADRCKVKIFTLAGDLVQTLEHDGRDAKPGDGLEGNGTVFWNLVSRNGQDIVSGIYIYSVECGGKSKVGRFVVVR
ncbi:MAG: hypothetical protein IT349_01215 [Candidatus Eisenbacteria bacterium]|nr:hypothetical protein [Candidatus Eisenbacteria bacterium]